MTKDETTFPFENDIKSSAHLKVPPVASKSSIKIIFLFLDLNFF